MSVGECAFTPPPARMPGLDRLGDPPKAFGRNFAQEPVLPSRRHAMEPNSQPIPSQPEGQPLRQDWLDEVARRRLPPHEAARWRRELARSRRPAEARCLDEELALNDALDALPRRPISADFTARVLSEIRSSPGTESLASRWAHRLRQLGAALAIPGPGDLLRSTLRPATIALAVLAVSLSWGWDRLQVRRHGAMARTAAEWSGAASMPGVAVLQDFEAIRLLETRSAPDDVALLQVLRDDMP